MAEEALAGRFDASTGTGFATPTPDGSGGNGEAEFVDGKVIAADVVEMVKSGGLASYTSDGNDPAANERRSWSKKNSKRSGGSIFDARGDELFSRWVNGSGNPLITGAKEWADYMIANKDLGWQIKDILEDDALTRKKSGPFYIRTQMELDENNYTTGYGMLHGTNADVGGFEIKGNAIMHGSVIHYAVTMTWNDIIDPNPDYDEDVWLDKGTRLFYNPKDYQVSIKWFQIITVKR